MQIHPVVHDGDPVVEPLDAIEVKWVRLGCTLRGPEMDIPLID